MLSGKPPPVGDDERKAEEGREQAGEKSLRPDVQGGALEFGRDVAVAALSASGREGTGFLAGTSASYATIQITC